MNKCRKPRSTVFSTLLLVFLLGWPAARHATLVVEGMGGIQQTKFAWNIARMGGTPIVLSELTFKSTAPKGTLGLRWLNQSEAFFIDTTIAFAQMTRARCEMMTLPRITDKRSFPEVRARSAATVFRTIKSRAAGAF